MPVYYVGVSKDYDRPYDNHDDRLLQIDGVIVIQADSPKEAIAQVDSMLDRSRPDILQTNDSRILWEAPIPKGAVYVDFSFDSTHKVYEEDYEYLSDFAYCHYLKDSGADA